MSYVTLSTGASDSSDDVNLCDLLLFSLLSGTSIVFPDKHELSVPMLVKDPTLLVVVVNARSDAREIELDFFPSLQPVASAARVTTNDSNVIVPRQSSLTSALSNLPSEVLQYFTGSNRIDERATRIPISANRRGQVLRLKSELMKEETLAESFRGEDVTRVIIPSVSGEGTAGNGEATRPVIVVDCVRAAIWEQQRTPPPRPPPVAEMQPPSTPPSQPPPSAPSPHPTPAQTPTPTPLPPRPPLATQQAHATTATTSWTENCATV